MALPGLDWTFAIAALVAGWAVLSVLGGERQRRFDVLIAEQAALAAAATAAATATPAADVPGH